VVVPAHNEENLILVTLGGMPDYVDHIIVIDDASQDSTYELITAAAQDDERIVCLKHEVNKGVGAAISTGYVWCRENDIDIAVVMAGDNQMDPNDLPALLDPIVENRTDYCKGNRLITGEAWKTIPRERYIGNASLSFLTKIASGYWHVADSQTGYTALNHKALHRIPLEDIYPRYGMPNDLLVTLNIYSLRVMDVPVRPVYGNEISGLKIRVVVFTLSILLLKLFARRMVQKYIIRDFHPLILFYFAGFTSLFLSFLFLIRVLIVWYQVGNIPDLNFLAFLFSGLSGSQMILFAMLFDMEANRDLKGK
jgi:glycosyltransferase involved in cell wall biosynthesis